MSTITRRQLLVFFGAGVGAAALSPVLENKLFGNASSAAQAAEALSFTPVRLPHPLPIYRQLPSYLATSSSKGQLLQPSKDARLTSYTVLDDVIVPPEYEYYVILSWGDRVFPNPDDYVGYNHDYTGFVPINGASFRGRENAIADGIQYNGIAVNDGYLWVNHEYVSYPISFLAPETPEDLAGFPESFPYLGVKINEKNRTLLGEFLYNMGGSIVRIRKGRDGRYAVVKDPKNRRIHTLSGLGINSDRTDAYKEVTSWGEKSHQKGDRNYLIGTGIAAKDVFEAVNADGLGNKIIGTGHNCSGGTTPWGTIMSAEENFQASEEFFVGVTEAVLPTGTQTEYIEGTTGAEFGMVGEKYGWMVEIDPANPKWRSRKHTALGRFRHENITMRAESGKKLVAYMGDDRRGGHTWKFVSAETVKSPEDKKNSKLFETGTLYVARYNPNGTGEWLPLEIGASTDPIPPSTLGSVEIEALGEATRDALLPLPRRNGIAGQTKDGGRYNVTTENEATALKDYQGKQLSNFYSSQGAVLVDAFLAANLIGGTPTARPEDLEINPRNPREVFIAYTDGAPGSDGYPDSRIFVVSKYSKDVNAGQPSGELFKIIEDSRDSTGLSFRWERLAKGGEAGAKPGDGFANVDNLAFDSQNNIWGVTDMSTGSHNGFADGAAGEQLIIDHTVVGAVVEGATSDLNVQTSDLIGVFGNNWLFYLPLEGKNAGQIVPFAYGPPRCEMTGPTFVSDTLIICVQHPGENVPFSPPQSLNRDIEMLNLDGTLFTQNRTVPRGSNWPSNLAGDPEGPPRPATIGIRRKDGKGDRFV